MAPVSTEPRFRRRKSNAPRATSRKPDSGVPVAADADAAKEGDAPGSGSTTRVTRSRAARCRPGSQEPLPPPSERSRSRRTTLATDTAVRERKRIRANLIEEEKPLTKMEEVGGEEISSAPSSPLCEPYLPDDQEIDFDTIDLYKKKSKEFHKKRDGNPLARCSGFLIDWNETTKVGVVITSADIICSASSLDRWSGDDEYSYSAKVFVHLLDDTTVEGRLIYAQTHYNLALFEIIVESPVQIPNFTFNLNYAQQIFVLGRDENLCLSISHGKVQYCNPFLCGRHHYMYVDTATPKCALGGLVIDFEGSTVGIACQTHAFIPSSILIKCLHLWRKIQCIPRPQLGVKLSAIKFLDLPHIEMILRKIHICDGLIVEEVSSGSTIEKLGVRVGDIIQHLNGEWVSDTIQLEEMLLRLSEDHFDKGNGLNSTLDIKVGLFHIRNGAQNTINLTTVVSENGEVVKRGSFAVSVPTREEISAMYALQEATTGIRRTPSELTFGGKHFINLPLENIGRSMTKEVPDDLLVISCEEDYETCSPLLKRGASVFESELILNGIVIQKLEYERHRLFLDRVKQTRSTRWLKDTSHGRFVPVSKCT
uniref:BRCT domain-containing protein n=1 Tax=Oryza glumipatula TaxID=40148 RepID=A0A0D9ZU58_9ORYZ